MPATRPPVRHARFKNTGYSSSHHNNNRQVWQTRSCSYHLGVPYNPICVLGATPESSSVLYLTYGRKIQAFPHCECFSTGDKALAYFAQINNILKYFTRALGWGAIRGNGELPNLVLPKSFVLSMPVQNGPHRRLTFLVKFYTRWTPA